MTSPAVFKILGSKRIGVMSSTFSGPRDHFLLVVLSEPSLYL